MQGFFDFVKSLGAARMAAMAAVTLALIGFFAFLMIQMTSPQMVPLFTDLSTEDSSAIVKDLERQAMPYKIKNDGTIVMVPKDKVARLRMKLAEGGLPKGGVLGYEIFRKSDALGAEIYEVAKDKLEDITRARGFEGRPVVMSDATIASGDCRIEWADGGINRNQAATLSAIDDVVGCYVAARTTATH